MQHLAAVTSRSALSSAVAGLPSGGGAAWQAQHIWYLQFRIREAPTWSRAVKFYWHHTLEKLAATKPRIGPSPPASYPLVCCQLAVTHAFSFYLLYFNGLQGNFLEKCLSDSIWGKVLWWVLLCLRVCRRRGKQRETGGWLRSLRFF